MNTKHLVVVDTETFGLGEHHHACEIAWRDLTSGHYGRFIPPFTQHDIDEAEPDALRINRFWERGLNREPQDDGTETRRLHKALTGNTLAGSNPGFDAAKLNKLFRTFDLVPDPWHYRFCDLGTICAGVLSLPFSEPPSLGKVCRLLGIRSGDHSALGDVQATARCFLKLQEIAAMRLAA